MIAAEPISYFQAIVLGLLQGVTELFPISSLGHSVIFPSLFGWNIHQNDDYFITFLVATHLATAIVLFGFFWHDWMRIFRGLGRSLRDRGIDPEDWDAKLGWLLVVGTIPAGILGLFEHALARTVRIEPQSASFCLMRSTGSFCSALRPSAAERRRRDEDDESESIDTVSFPQSFVVGAAQAIALIPGFSRSGSRSRAERFLWVDRDKDAARFAFLLATPIIGAAAVLKLPELFGSQGDGIRGQALVASLCSALTAYFSVRFLHALLRDPNAHPVRRLVPCVRCGPAPITSSRPDVM